jgi:hypothetical protein
MWCLILAHRSRRGGVADLACARYDFVRIASLEMRIQFPSIVFLGADAVEFRLIVFNLGFQTRQLSRIWTRFLPVGISGMYKPTLSSMGTTFPPRTAVLIEILQNETLVRSITVFVVQWTKLKPYPTLDKWHVAWMNGGPFLNPWVVSLIIYRWWFEPGERQKTCVVDLFVSAKGV